MFVDSEASEQAWNYRTVSITTNDTALYITLKPGNPDETYELALAFEDFANDTNNDFITEVSGEGFTELIRRRHDLSNSSSTESSGENGSQGKTRKSTTIGIFKDVYEYYAFTVRIPLNLTTQLGNYTVGIRGKSK